MPHLATETPNNLEATGAQQTCNDATVISKAEARSQKWRREFTETVGPTLRRLNLELQDYGYSEAMIDVEWIADRIVKVKNIKPSAVQKWIDRESCSCRWDARYPSPDVVFERWNQLRNTLCDNRLWKRIWASQFPSCIANEDDINFDVVKYFWGLFKILYHCVHDDYCLPTPLFIPPGGEDATTGPTTRHIYGDVAYDLSLIHI